MIINRLGQDTDSNYTSFTVYGVNINVTKASGATKLKINFAVSRRL